MKQLLFVLPMILGLVATVAQEQSALKTATRHYQEENYAEALKFLNIAAVEEPSNAQVPYLTARAYVDMNNYRKAAAFMEKAIAMDSTKPHWFYECGLIYYAIPDNKKSLQYILLAGEKGYKRSTDYLENLANAYMNAGQPQQAIAIYLEVLKKKPSDPELLYATAEAFYKTGRFQEAIDYWDHILEDDKGNAQVLYMIGMAYQKKGEKEKGQQLCDRAIEMDPSLRSNRQRRGGDL